MFDLQATLRWVTELFKDADGTAASYRQADPTWQTSFLQITLPLYVGSFLVASVLGFFTSTGFLFGSIPFILFSLVWGLAWTFVIAFIFDYFAGLFDGESGFDRAYAVVALAIIPSALGTAISPIARIGGLLSLAAGIYSLILAYRFLPQFLTIPDDTRVKHFVVSILAALVVNIVVSLTMGQLYAPSMAERFEFETESESEQREFGQQGGLLGGVARQADIAEAAAADTYTPPTDGKLTEAQVARYVDVIGKTRQLRERMDKKMKEVKEEEASISDVFSGIGGVMRLSTAEMEVVKTGGGNWAEHQWVKGQLETARIQQDLNDTTAHNYELFQEYQQEIEQFE